LLACLSLLFALLASLGFCLGGSGGLAPPPSLAASRALLCFAVLCLASLSFALLCAPLIHLPCLPACFALLDFAVSLASFCLLASRLAALACCLLALFFGMILGVNCEDLAWW